MANRYRQYLLKLLLFFAVPIAVDLVFVALTPPNLWTFRAWESLSYHEARLHGFNQFYPDQRLVMVEQGDLGHSAGQSQYRKTTFITDHYGFRYSKNVDSAPIVIVGDSFVIGSGLDQADTLAEVMTGQLHTTVYPYSPVLTTQPMFADPRFRDHLPGVVVLAVVERDIGPENCAVPEGAAPPSQNRLADALPGGVTVVLDRALREPSYIQSFLRARAAGRDISIGGDRGPQMLFNPQTVAMPPLASIGDIVASLSKCQADMKARGIRLIFLPIPDKENIYFDDLPDNAKSVQGSEYPRSAFMHQLIDRSREQGIEVADIQTAFEEARARGIELYQVDDTHWNGTAVRIAAAQIEALLGK